MLLSLLLWGPTLRELTLAGGTLSAAFILPALAQSAKQLERLDLRGIEFRDAQERAGLDQLRELAAALPRLACLRVTSRCRRQLPAAVRDALATANTPEAVRAALGMPQRNG